MNIIIMIKGSLENYFGHGAEPLYGGTVSYQLVLALVLVALSLICSSLLFIVINCLIKTGGHLYCPSLVIVNR